jgi:hypothetical protein
VDENLGLMDAVHGVHSTGVLQHVQCCSYKIAGSDFERPKAGPEGVEHRDVRNNPLGDAMLPVEMK